MKKHIIPFISGLITYNLIYMLSKAWGINKYILLGITLVLAIPVIHMYEKFKEDKKHT